MKKMLACLLALLIAPAAFALETGKAAPDFTAKASNGKTVKLSDYKGKTVVLEWLNYGCPFVKKHYESKNMQNLQKKYTGEGVVWISVISSAPGKQGYADAKQAEADKATHGSNATAILLDEKGEVGKAYGALTTPHMYVIDKSGKLVYQGAIDDKASTEVADVKAATNYVSAALDATKAGKPVAVSQTKAYGCGVKYN
jgi:peroxiredoxin